jgi:hypothetical protein
MAVWKKPASSRPLLPAGLVASGLLGVAPAPSAAPAPADAVAAKKSKKKTKQGRQGRLKLARAMEFKISKNKGNMAMIGNFPFGEFTKLVAKEDSPLHELRQGPKWQVCRMAMFLLQMVMNLTKSYTPNPKLEYRFGSELVCWLRSAKSRSTNTKGFFRVWVVNPCDFAEHLLYV